MAKRWILYFWYRCIGALFRIMPIEKKTIVFSSFFGKGYGDSPKFIAEEMLRNEKYKIVWLVRDWKQGTFPKTIKVVKRGTIEELYYLSVAHMWVDNERKPLGLKKRKNQYYIQTWHSNLRLKKIEKDAEEYLPKEYIKCAKNDSKMIDAMIAGSEFGYNTIRNSFWYDGPIYKTGIPRCDELFNIDPKEIKKTKEKLNIESYSRIYLYAPTFRNNKEIDLSKIDELVQKLDAAYGNGYKLLVRFHPLSKQIIKETSKIINVTSYPDIQELINTANILITDYSGCMFDAIIAHKPCILFTPDCEEYIKNERELYFDFEELPFENTHTFSELADAIISFRQDDYNKKANAFLKKIGCYEKGESSKNVAALVEKLMEE